MVLDSRARSAPGQCSDAPPCRGPERSAAQLAPRSPLIQAQERAFDAVLEAREFSVFRKGNQVLDSISLRVPPNRITALIGPSEAGKSTLLRCFNRMHDQIEGVRVQGELEFQGQSLLEPGIDVCELRRSIALISRPAAVFPAMSIRDNVLFGARIHGLQGSRDGEDLLERSLRRVDLFDLVKEQLDKRPHILSRGQGQRLCLARSLAVRPTVLLLDEPCAGLDSIESQRIELLLRELSTDYSTVLVTHDLHQARRLSDYTAFLSGGRLIEFRETRSLFLEPRDLQTQAYISGRPL